MSWRLLLGGLCLAGLCFEDLGGGFRRAFGRNCAESMPAPGAGINRLGRGRPALGKDCGCFGKPGSASRGGFRRPCGRTTRPVKKTSSGVLTGLPGLSYKPPIETAPPESGAFLLRFQGMQGLRPVRRAISCPISGEATLFDNCI
jgi:hypothetical protein